MKHNITNKYSFLLHMLEMYVIGLKENIKKDINRTDLYQDFKYQFYINHLHIINLFLKINLNRYIIVCLKSCKNKIKQMFLQYEYEKYEYEKIKF